LASTTSVFVPGSSSPAGAADPTASELFAPLPDARRVVDTRTPNSTVDGVLAGGGARAAGSTLTIQIGGRAGVPGNAGSVILNVTSDGATETGFVTMFACDALRPTASNLNFVAGRTVATMVITRLSSAGTVCAYTSGATQLIVDVAGSFSSGSFNALAAPQRIADSRPGNTTADGRYQGGGPRPSDSVLTLPVAGRVGVAGSARTVVLTVTADAATEIGYVTVYPCGSAIPLASSLNYGVGDTAANTVVTRLSGGGEVCLLNHGAADLIVDVAGSLANDSYTSLDSPARLVDTRVRAETIDGKVAGKGQRPGDSTLRVPVAGRAGLPAGVGTVMVNVTAIGADDGFITAHPRGGGRPTASNLNVSAGRTVANAALVRVGEAGEICMFVSGNADLIVDVVGYLPGAPVATGGECPDQQLLPHWRMVALYGNGTASGLGALGEQPPEQAAARLETVAAPFRGLGRPVLKTFELIATVAQASAGPSGLYREGSSDAEIQRWLDTARRHGLYLVLDIQPGRSDFLTEVKRYEKFLREPDVGIALDPEWRVGPFSLPGRVIGSVSAAEINATADYVANLVREEDLPEKLFVIHQFQIRMIPDRYLVEAKPGLAIMFHMDGFGSRGEKMATWGFVQTGPPFHNGFKLFYDEDSNRYRPDEVVALTPTPDLITYQ
jgi:hypothetical protein